jgi:hypothetical protein
MSTKMHHIQTNHLSNPLFNYFWMIVLRSPTKYLRSLMYTKMHHIQISYLSATINRQDTLCIFFSYIQVTQYNQRLVKRLCRKVNN